MKGFFRLRLNIFVPNVFNQRNLPEIQGKNLISLFCSCKGEHFIKKNAVNLLSANATKWSNALKQFINNLPTNYLSVFDHFVRLMLKDLANNKMVNEKVKQVCRKQINKQNNNKKHYSKCTWKI